MNILALSLLSIGFYTLGTFHQSLIYLRKIQNKPFISMLIGTIAVSSHALIAYQQIFTDNEIILSFFNTASLVALFVISGLIIFSARKPLQAVFIFCYPVAALSLISSLIFNNDIPAFNPENSGIFIHITLSIISYSIFSIAVIQGILVYMQNNNLKKRNHTVLLRNLPPLLTMENLLFEMIWSGTILLGLAIIAGSLFVDNLFAQHLVHKTILSIIAFAIFSTLLAGRHFYGWRGLTASKWTLWGFSFLLIGFFGSKLVLEQILK
tara:strand:- start:12849 stop:13646 length:798 start_codon:yes stop_codon:yes gene_type:complete